MARRASSSAHPIWIIAALLLCLAAVVGGYLIYSHVGDPFRTIAPLPVADYLENSNSLRGNVYKIDATIAKSIEWSPKAGRLFSVEVGSDVLPVLNIGGHAVHGISLPPAAPAVCFRSLIAFSALP